MLTIDGRVHEGGGQIVRTALAISAFTGKAVRIEHIRAGRKRPGLKTQHLRCIEALKQLCGAQVEGASLGSGSITFVPGRLKATTIEIDMQTAGSVTLLLQSILLPLLRVPRGCTLSLRGGTNGMWAMPVEFVQNVVVPYLKVFYQKLDVRVVRRGYYPIGGGEVHISSSPQQILASCDSARELRAWCSQHSFKLVQRPVLQAIFGLAHASDALRGDSVTQTMVDTARRELREYGVPVDIAQEYSDTRCVGMGMTLWARYEDGSERVPMVVVGGDALADRRFDPRSVALEASRHVRKHMESVAVVDPHVADNLVPFMALAGGRVRVGVPTPHVLANMYVCEKMLGCRFDVDDGVLSAQVGEFEIVF